MFEVSLGPRPGRGWVSVTRGAHRLAEVPHPLHADLTAWQSVLPDEASFTHLTAAVLLGWPTPPLPSGLPVFVGMDRSSSPERVGLRVSRHNLAPPYAWTHGLRVATPSEVLLACARDLSLLDLLVLTDFALHERLCSLDDLHSASAAHRRGTPLLRRAIRLADSRSESPWETLLRTLHVTCGIDVEAQRVVHDHEGRFVARGDLWLVGTRTLHEYDGAHHLTRERQRKDLGRNARIAQAEWSRRGFTREDVLHQGVQILREADDALHRSHRPERIRAWHALLRDSLYTPSGQARLRARLRLPTH